MNGIVLEDKISCVGGGEDGPSMKNLSRGLAEQNVSDATRILLRLVVMFGDIDYAGESGIRVVLFLGFSRRLRASTGLFNRN